MPPGFPKGNTAFTTAKVIVARAFSPPTNTWKYAKLPFDPEQSEHATHVAGIAAGDYSPGAIAGRGPLSGVAPQRLPRQLQGADRPDRRPSGLNGNSPEIAAGDRGGRQGRHGRDQPLARRARDRADPRPRRRRDQRGRRRRASSRRSQPGTTSATSAAARSPRPAARRRRSPPRRSASSSSSPRSRAAARRRSRSR